MELCGSHIFCVKLECVGECSKGMGAGVRNQFSGQGPAATLL